MPRSIWSGAISFGLVTVPVNVASATESHSISFHQYHLEDMGRVRYRKICEIEDRQVDESEIGKGYELAKDHIIPISDADLENLPLPTAKAVEIEAFVPLESIDPIRISAGYYLTPKGQVAAKPYKLLREALGRSSRVAIAKWAWHGRERLGMLRVRDEALVLHVMYWPDEIRDPTELLPPPVELTESEIDGALALIDSMTREALEGPEFHDSYTDALAQIIEAKREDKPMPEAPEPADTDGKVFDLMAALNESVAKAKASRGEGPAEVHELRKKAATAKKTPAKKQPAKKTAAKKGTAKKTAGRRPRSA
ncbi:non-homologous end joining protein Ku [Streptomyces sp. NBC_00299]|uniref:non-homologous end joining protein Ku n=1 Tax=Streptomyces sp. NBC_00299 TaxID=2975705 RepID=UPI002E2C653F|nr:Ku protein [Streptomyces sp. NBC_00299]